MIQPTHAALLDVLRSIPGLVLRENVPLAQLTRFAIGGPADVLAETGDPRAFVEAIQACRRAGAPFYVIGDGSNLVVSDRGYRGVVLRFAARDLGAEGTHIVADAGAPLQELVDFSIGRGLAGLETLTGIPGSVGAAVYGNAGAYGHSISERVSRVEVFDGEALREFANADCRFEYRESIFKKHKDWMILRAHLDLTPGDAAALRRRADEIRKVRDEKFPPAMKCAGSIFKNLLVAELPAAVVAAIPAEAIREGKVASAYFLDQVGAKGTARNGIQVADYHANLIYNSGSGTAADLRAVIAELRGRVQERFGITLEEEVQYLGDWQS
ncbi:MAG TPA: UDP-N-acetylmuramate dehydrogenase [Bryobacterales bacterium]|nr:UDP-N-acetylmuramate dehydrogenase [Bryobacterales bacterium]